MKSQDYYWYYVPTLIWKYFQVSLLFTAPPLMVLLAKNPLVDKYDLSSVSDIWCGAAPLSKELELAVIKRIGVKRVQQMYGLTETTIMVIHNSMAYVAKPGSCGKCLPGTQIKVKWLCFVFVVVNYLDYVFVILCGIIYFFRSQTFKKKFVIIKHITYLVICLIITIITNIFIKL